MESTNLKPTGISVKPTVGRMVYYKSYGTPNGEYKSVDRAAVITAVHLVEGSDPDPKGDTIDICVFNPEGLFFNHRGVKQGQEGGQWDWMPFQKDQVARMAPGTLNESHLGAIPNGPLSPR